jgi:hypothetical protein
MPASWEARAASMLVGNSAKLDRLVDMLDGRIVMTGDGNAPLTAMPGDGLAIRTGVLRRIRLPRLYERVEFLVRQTVIDLEELGK